MARNARKIFLQRFQKGKLPENIEEISLDIEGSSILLTNLLKESGLTASVSESSRMIKQGAVKIDQEKVTDLKLEITKNTDAIYQVGKRKIMRIKI